jgi:GTP-binding protein
MLQIKSATFEKSSTQLAQLPQVAVPEFACIGRSNVGKSSLINMITGRKGLAKTSATPGKTRLINHFKLNDAFYLVDLPGYGYAKVSQKDRAEFQKMIWDYLLKRPQLVSLLVLIDCRHEPLAIDQEFIDNLGEAGVPFALVFTKADKLSKAQQAKMLALYKRVLLRRWHELPPVFVTSAETGQGRANILDYFEQCLNSITA